jgi:hypothetical protein
VRGSLDALTERVRFAVPELLSLDGAGDQAVTPCFRSERRHASNGPTEAINGRVESLGGNAPGSRNTANHIAQALLDTGGFRPRMRPLLPCNSKEPKDAGVGA